MRSPRLRHILLLFVFIASLLTSLPAKAQINTERVMNIGRNALYFNDYVLAIQYFNQVIDVKPFMAEPYLFRAIAKMSLEDYQGANEDCSEALDRNPFMVRAYYCRSYARLQLKDYQGAVADCEKGLEFDTENKSLMLNKAVAKVYAKEYEAARQDLDYLIKKFPNYLFGYMSRGQLCVEENDTLGAIDDFSRAIAVDKYHAPAYAARAYVSLLRENYADAIIDLNEAIRLEPDNEGYYVNRGLARYYNKDFRGVFSDFDRVLQLNPYSAMTYYNRGLIRAEVGDNNNAISDFDKVIELEPNNDLAFYNRALLRQTTGDLQGAEEDLSEIIKRYPNFIPAYYQRSEVRKKQGDAKGADKDYFHAWDLENQLKADKEAGREFSAKGDGKTRSEDDLDINKYNLVVVSESEAEQTARYANPIRGNVQNLNVEVEVEPLFTLSFYEEERPIQTKKAMNYEPFLEKLAQDGVPMYKLRITNTDRPLKQSEIDYHFRSIDLYSKKIEEHQNQAVFYFARAIDFALVKDIDNAITDLSRAIYLQNDFVLAYFHRANLRFQQILFYQADGSLSDKHFGNEFMLVMQDLDKITEMAPGFIYAWYNRGNMRFMQKDYRSALEDYNRAIELNPDFAEAWYNRGVTRIHLGERAEGIRDLSRAGELGIYKAYNLIKRFSE